MPSISPDTPFAPRRLPFFYGWVVLGACIVGTLCSIPGQTIGVGVFTAHLCEALGLTRTQLSTAYMLGTGASSLILPFAGKTLDAIGARWMVVVSALGLGVSLLGLAGAGLFPADAGRAAPYLAIGLAFVVFLMIRFFGQGCLTMVSRVTIGKWFNHHRGTATAITTVFVAFGFNGAPQGLNLLVHLASWQGAALILAAGVGVGMSLFGWLLYRDNPEECGLVMDGIRDPERLKRLARRVPPTRHEFTRGEALRTPAFWVFSAGAGLQAMVMTAAGFHIEVIGAEVGLTGRQSFAVFLPTAFIAIPTTLLAGWLSDRVRMKWILLAMLAGQALALTGMLNLADPVGRALFTVGYGVSGGLFGVVLTVTWPRYFGRRRLGAISGVNMSILVFASAIGPVLWSAAQGVTGSYAEVTAACWFLPALTLLAALKVKNPQLAYPEQDA